ncbi:MAG: hypothetical protein FWG87_12655 [Defluviitaleaceae bacterium]|nr:hypothetical protein [Defluviitaleaceae bacterium]
MDINSLIVGFMYKARPETLRTSGTQGFWGTAFQKNNIRCLYLKRTSRRHTSSAYGGSRALGECIT